MKLYIKESDQRAAITVQSIIEVNRALSSVFKKAYRNANGLSPTAKVTNLKIYAKDFKSGSLEQIYELINEHAAEAVMQMTFAAMNFNLKDVYDITKMALEAHKIISTKKKTGQEIKLDIQSGNNSPVLTIINTGTLTLSESVFKTMIESTSAGEMLTAPIRRGDVKEIGLSSETSGSVSFTSEDKDCFSVPHEISDEIKKITGNIFSFNKEKRIGSVAFVDESQKQRSLRFKIVNDNILLSVIESMKRATCRLYCLEEYISGPQGEKNVVGLLVTKVEVL